MKACLVVVAGLCLFAAAAHAADDPTVSLPGVVDLTPENFDQIVNGGKHALVEFYAPWCGHCKRMTGEFKKLGEIIEADPTLKSRVVVGKVNADTHKELGGKFEVRGFPTILYFGRGKAVNKESAGKYDQARTSDAFLTFLKKKLEEDNTFARVEELDEIVKTAAAGKKSDLAGLVTKAEAAVKKLKGDDKDNGALYVKFLQKAQDKGVDFFAKEHARLQRMMGSGSVAEAKLQEMLKKTSVLSAFLPAEEEKAAEV